MKYQTILDTIGNTPVVELKRYSSQTVRIFAKLEGTNPGGSIKDRIALSMIRRAERTGILATNSTIIEATSGNTGIGLAMISAIKGYRFIAIMSENASIQRRNILKTYGAEYILVDTSKNSEATIEKASQLVKEEKYIMLNQYENRFNPAAHYLTTGREIIHQVPGLTHFVAGIGTGGTITGIGKRLKEYNADIRVFAIEPKPHTTIQGLRNMSVYTPSIFGKQYIDEILPIEQDEAAFDLMKDLAQHAGISAGISSGAALWGALEIKKTIKQGTIVTVFPDRGDRYG